MSVLSLLYCIDSRLRRFEDICGSRTISTDVRWSGQFLTHEGRKVDTLKHREKSNANAEVSI